MERSPSPQLGCGEGWAPPLASRGMLANELGDGGSNPVGRIEDLFAYCQGIGFNLVPLTLDV